jgi:hypothetical protein
MPRSGRFSPGEETWYPLYRRQFEGYYSYLIQRLSTLELVLRLCFFFWCDSLPVGQGLLIHEVSRAHTTAHHSR